MKNLMKRKIGNHSMTRLKILITLSMLFSFALDAKLTAKVDRTELLTGETLNLVIAIDKNSNSQPDLSVLNNSFRVLGNSSSMSTQIINGQYSFTKSWNISLLPLTEGNLRIPEITIDNETTQAIDITVKKADPNAKANGDIFIEVTTDKISAFVKEQVIIKVKLFYSMSLSEGSLSEPYASDTLVTMLDKNSTFSTVRDGKRYEVIERHYALFSEKSGTMEINPILFNGRDNSSRRSMSVFSTGKPVRAVSKPISIEIKPIPQNAIGSDWLPASKLSLSETWSKGPFTVGEPITRNITLFAEGLSETQVPDIDLGDIENIKNYPEQPQTQTEITPKTIKAIKQVKIAMIPTREGTLRVPEYSLQWFDTDSGELKQAKLPPRTLNVQAGIFSTTPNNIKDQINDLQGELTGFDDKKLEEASATQPILIKQEPYWKWLTALFALLWLTTLFYKFNTNSATKKNRDSNQPKLSVSKKDIYHAIETKDANQLQRSYIQWWNQEHPKQRINNLSALSKYLNDDDYVLVSNLQSNLYNNDNNEFDYMKFKTFVSNKIIYRKNREANSEKILPKLYG